jgi:predicted nucleic acid-binding protein
LIIVDTSVWADHFRARDSELIEVISGGQIVQHPYVTGELALGNPSDRSAMFAILSSLPQIGPEAPQRFLDFVERQALGGTGIGFVDANLLASASATGARVWSRDKKLAAQADRLGLAYRGE